MKTAKMIFAVVMIALMLSFTQIGNAQLELQWERTYGGETSDQCNCLIQTFDGGFAAAGLTWSSGNGDFWLIRTDEDGNVLWDQTYGGNALDECHSIIQCPDSGFALAGYAYSFGDNCDGWLIRTDEDGNVLWDQTYNGENFDQYNCLIQTFDGGFAVAGETRSFDNGDFLLVRTDTTGNTLWSRIYDGADRDECNSLVQTADSGFVLGGTTLSVGAGDFDFWLVRTDTTGNTLWSRTYGDDGVDKCCSVIQTLNGGFALAGCTRSVGAGDFDFWLVRTDTTGNTLWSRTYGGDGRDMCHSLIQTADGGFVMGGHTIFSGIDCCLIRTDTTGNTLWSMIYGNENREECHSLIQTADGGYAWGGENRDFEFQNSDFWLVKTGPDPLGVTGFEELLALRFQLLSAYPNPFNATAVITFNLPSIDVVRLGIYDLYGREVRTVNCGVLPSGFQTISLDGADLSAGTYLIRLQTGNFSASRQITLIK